MLPDGAREKLLQTVNAARDRLVVTWLADGRLRIGELCGLHLIALHLREDAACSECRADLVVDRTAFNVDHPGQRLHHRAHRCRPEAHSTQALKANADLAFERAECIDCGACVAACPKGVPLTSIANMNRELLRAARRPQAACQS
ncbi:Fe-S-cluster-containing hydrogenase component 2 [Kitasatospora sp. GAS204A]|nr:Fe-S-cluster-containing hydrogenase component 2 [Kitasatospora sp. GAS204B]